MQKQRFFYELLVRANASGVQGAHVLYLDRVLDDDGTVLKEAPTDAIPISMVSGDPGVPLATVLGDVNTASLMIIDAKNADIAAANQARDAAVAAQATAEAERDALRAQLGVPTVVNGVPQVVTRRFGRKALILSGLMVKVNAAIASIADETQRDLVQNDFDDSENFERQNPTLLLLARALNLTDEAIDDLFILAGKLQAGENVSATTPPPADAQSTGIVAWFKNLLGLS